MAWPFTIYLHTHTQNTDSISVDASHAYPRWWIVTWVVGVLLVLGGAHVAYGQNDALAARTASAAEGTITGTVVDAKTNGPLPGVNVVVEGTAQGAVTDAEGRYTLPVAAGDVALTVSYIGYETVEAEIDVAGGATVEKDFVLEEDLVGIDEVVVVGSRVNERTVLESAVPIDVLSSEELETSAQVGTAEMLQTMAPSINFPREGMGDGTETVRPIYFRGLGPDQLLVLINGKRRHTSAIRSGGSSAGVDLNAIPQSAIERIEILRDGASAQYGSDAVSGVINIILKDNPGTALSTRTGLYSEGDGETAQLNLNHGFTVGSNGFFHVSGDFRYNDYVNRAGPDGNQQYWGTTRNGDGEIVYEAPQEDRLNELWQEDPQVTFRMGEPMRIGGGLFFNGEFRLGEGATSMYTFGGVSHRFAESGCFYRRASQSARYSVLYPNGFLPLYSNYTTDASAAVGLKGLVGSWTWDASTTYGGNLFQRNMDNTHNATLQEYSPTYMKVGSKAFQQIAANFDVTRTVDVGMANPLNIGMGTELRVENYQIGAGQRESYIDGGFDIPTGPDAGEQPAVGCQCFPGFRPSDEVSAWRQNVGAYLDLSMDVTDALFLTTAGRFENYSDFGSTATVKAAGRFEFIDGYAVRSAFNTGFRAPSMLQTYYSSTQTGFFRNEATGELEGREVRTLPISSPAAQALGAAELEPETSRNISAGITMNPIRSLTLTADYYNIRVDDRIVLTSNFFASSNPQVAQLFDDAGLENIAGGRFFTNAVDTRTYGVDIVARYGLDLGAAGTARFTGSMNFTRNRVIGITGTPPELSDLEENIFDEEREMAFELNYPRQNLSLMLNYEVSRFGVMLRGWRPGEVVGAETADLDGDGTSERVILDGYNRVPPTWIADLEVSYGFSSGLTVALGGTNLFDRRPPKARAVEYQGQTFDSRFNGNFPYVNQFDNSFGVSGGFYYVRANYTF